MIYIPCWMVRKIDILFDQVSTNIWWAKIKICDNSKFFLVDVGKTTWVRKILELKTSLCFNCSHGGFNVGTDSCCCTVSVEIWNHISTVWIGLDIAVSWIDMLLPETTIHNAIRDTTSIWVNLFFPCWCIGNMMRGNWDTHASEFCGLWLGEKNIICVRERGTNLHLC